jgi:hypothetical protein
MIGRQAHAMKLSPQKPSQPGHCPDMKCTHQEQTTLETRIARLERTNGVYRKLLLLPFLGAGVLAMAGFKQLDGVQDLVKAKKFIVVDDDGKERVVIGRPAGELGKEASGVFVYDPKGTLRVCTASPQPDPPGQGQRRETASGVLIFDATGRERGGLATLNDGAAVCLLDGKEHEAVGMAVWPNGLPTFAMWNPAVKEYQPSVWLNVGLNGYPGLSFIDPNNKSRMILGISPDTKAGLSLSDANEKELLRFKLSGDGTPDVELKK